VERFRFPVSTSDTFANIVRLISALLNIDFSSAETDSRHLQSSEGKNRTEAGQTSEDLRFLYCYLVDAPARLSTSLEEIKQPQTFLYDLTHRPDRCRQEFIWRDLIEMILQRTLETMAPGET
jgi:hypothetical protein